VPLTTPCHARPYHPVMLFNHDLLKNISESDNSEDPELNETLRSVEFHSLGL
jgi:hypothetical protein